MIKINSLKYINNKKCILNDINLELPNKGIIFLTGVSGSGKTTFLKCIEGLLKYSGSIIYNDLEVIENKDYLRRNEYGIITQELNLIDNISCYENVKLALDITGIIDNQEHRINKALSNVGLNKYKKSLAGLLSGGEKQRLAIARAIVKKPNALFCDEITSALDDDNKYLVMDILKELSKDMIIVITSHDEELVYKYADRVIKIASGSIIDDKVFNTDNDNVKSNYYKRKIYKHKIFNKPLKYSMLAISVLIFILSVIIGISIYDDGTNYYKHDENLSVILNKDNKRVEANDNLIKLISDNEGVITKDSIHLSGFGITYGTSFNVNIIENISKSSYAQLYSQKVQYKLKHGRGIKKYDEIIIDSVLAQKIIKYMNDYGYKINYEEMINSIKVTYSDCIFKIVGVSDVGFNGIYINDSMYYSLLNNRITDMYIKESRMISYYKKSEYNNSLNTTSNPISNKINVYTNTLIDESNRDYNVIGSIDNAVSDNDVVFYSEDDYLLFIRKCSMIFSSINNNDLIVKPLNDAVVLASGEMPKKDNEILLPWYLESVMDNEYVKSSLKFLDKYIVSGYYKLDYSIDFTNYPLIYVSDFSYLKSKIKGSFCVYNISELDQYIVMGYNDYENSINSYNEAITIVLYSISISSMVCLGVWVIIDILKCNRIYIIERLFGVSKKEIIGYSAIEINKLLLFYVVPQVFAYSLFVILGISNYIYFGLFIIFASQIVIFNLINLILNTYIMLKPINKELLKK